MSDHIITTNNGTFYAESVALNHTGGVVVSSSLAHRGGAVIMVSDVNKGTVNTSTTWLSREGALALAEYLMALANKPVVPALPPDPFAEGTTRP